MRSSARAFTVAVVACVAGCGGAKLDVSADAGADARPAFGPWTPNPPTKIDILFDVDNSGSMGDKQDYIKAAIPDLINRLINPDCIDTHGNSYGPSSDGTCSNAAFQPEFAPINDMHIGIVSSSLGSRGGNVCNPSASAPIPFENVSAHNDDQAHLIARTLFYSNNDSSVVEGSVADVTATDPYLYWYPTAPNVGKTPAPGQPVTNPGQLINDFTGMVGGAGVFGCGIPSQLESWYRFLVQPDPYQSIVVNNGRASWSGVDATILQQRHDFLRPDSMVVVVVISDTNDAEIDVRSLGGLAYSWMNTSFTPPRGTSACQDVSPDSPSCVSCAQQPTPQDPNCTGASAVYSAPDDWAYDIRLRHVHMKYKYGVDLQFPIERYVIGLTSTTVPDRNGEYPPGASSYVGTLDCQNPLFAAVLPDGSDTSPDTLCHAPPGTRTKDLVYYVHIGGVPNQLLHFDPRSLANSVLSAQDWVKILGNDPEHYDYTGIDPHMIESYQPRPGLPPPGSPNNADPISGHEWITDLGGGQILGVDLEYACIYPLSDAHLFSRPPGNPAAQARNQNPRS